MKKILFICLFIGSFSGIFSQNASSVIYLSTSDFLSKVYNFEKNPSVWVYEGDLPCIVDFYTDWCRPCREVAPIVEEIARKYEGKIIVYKLNLDRERRTAAALGIRAFPSFLFVPMQDIPTMLQGAMPLEEFERAINQILLK